MFSQSFTTAGVVQPPVPIVIAPAPKPAPPQVHVPPPTAQPLVPAPAAANPAAANVGTAPNGGIPNIIAPSDYTIIPPTTPGGVLSLTAQHVHIQDTIRGSLLVIEADLAFQDGFPDAQDRNQFVHNALIQTARLLDYLGLEQRLTDDRAFMRSISTLVSAMFCFPIVTYTRDVTSVYSPPCGTLHRE